jgi:hypothetical protein
MRYVLTPDTEMAKYRQARWQKEDVLWLSLGFGSGMSLSKYPM